MTVSMLAVFKCPVTRLHKRRRYLFAILGTLARRFLPMIVAQGKTSAEKCPGINRQTHGCDLSSVRNAFKIHFVFLYV